MFSAVVLNSVRIRPAPLEFPFPSVSQRVHSPIGVVFSLENLSNVVDAANSKSDASI